MPTHRIWLFIAAIFLLIIFIQNTAVVAFNILFWQIEMSRIFMFALLVVIGIAIGWLSHAYVTKQRAIKRRKTETVKD